MKTSHEVFSQKEDIDALVARNVERLKAVYGNHASFLRAEKHYIVSLLAKLQTEEHENEPSPSMLMVGEKIDALARSGYGDTAGNPVPLSPKNKGWNDYFVVSILAPLAYDGDPPKDYTELAFRLEEGSASFTR